MDRLWVIVAGCAIMAAAASPAVYASAIEGKSIEYMAGQDRMEGYLAYDTATQGKRPGVQVVPEWWGVTEYARTRARMLAGLGYTALVVDMYGQGRQADNPDEAQKLSSEVMTHFNTIGKTRFLAAFDVLKKQPTVEADRIAAIGYCFGGGVVPFAERESLLRAVPFAPAGDQRVGMGGADADRFFGQPGEQVLNMARQGTDLKGVVSFHGSLTPVTPAKPGEVRAKILVLHGEADTIAPLKQLEAFREEMNKAGADYRIVTYPGAKHAFTNPEADEYARRFNMPVGYSAKADRESWEEMRKFLKQVLGR
jgi:dienelactone hydrolase